MFIFKISFMSILEGVAQRCGIPYVSIIHEVMDDGSHLYGIEVELPPMFGRTQSSRVFYWAPSGIDSNVAYEAAALQAIMALQSIYGFVIHDYSFHGLVLCTGLARRLLPLASGAVQLATLLVTASDADPEHHARLMACVYGLAHYVQTMAAGF
jgi:hypothetical protein